MTFQLKGKNDAKWLSLLGGATAYYIFGPGGTIPLAFVSKLFGPGIVDFLNGLNESKLGTTLANLLSDLTLVQDSDLK